MVDESGARVRLKAMTRPPDLKELDEQIERLNQDKEEAVANQDFERAAALRDQADKLKKKKETITREWRERSKEVDGTVDEEVIAEVVSKMTGIPLTRLETEETARLLKMEEDIQKRVISQSEAIRRISEAVRRSRAGLKDPKRPIGSFIFAGPTGVGKTLLAKALAEFMFGDADALLQIDMSEYMEKHNVSRLIGRLQVTSAMRKGASSPRRSAAGRTRLSSWTRSRRPTPTSTTCSSRSWKRAG